MSKYLIIGNRGTLGNEFVNLISSDQQLAVDRNELDITDQNAVKDFLITHKPEVVINCAAYTNVDGAESDYEAAHKINAEAVGYLSSACNQVNARLVHFSTGMVFPGTDPEGYNENTEPQPVNNYGVSKLAGEKIIQNSCNNHYLIRTEWLYGKPASESAKKSFVELMIELGKSGKVKGVTDEIGKPTWAKDLAQATIELIQSGKPNGIYHLANEGKASRLDWVNEIYKITEMTAEIEPVSGSSFPRPAKRPEFELINNTKLPKMRSWQEALQEYLTL